MSIKTGIVDLNKLKVIIDKLLNDKVTMVRVQTTVDLDAVRLICDDYKIINIDTLSWKEYENRKNR